jgi:murein DD-endopeptidase MepM/ murein hydrolase activator NlpD
LTAYHEEVLRSFSALTLFFGLSVSSASALELHVSPAQPGQGDTISVVVTGAEHPPTVHVGDRRFTAFDIGNGRYRAFVPVSPLDKPGPWSIAIEAGSAHTSVTVPVAARRFGEQHITLPPHVKTEADPIELARIGAAKALRSAAKQWNGVFLAPAAGRISSVYGTRRWRNRIFLKDYYHRGIDYAPGGGAPASAPAGGRVVVVGHEKEGFTVNGNTVAIDHGHGVVSVLLHLATIDVAEGDTVRAGQRVGTVGATGIATGPHLHWGFFVEGISVDPRPWLQNAIE